MFTNTLVITLILIPALVMTKSKGKSSWRTNFMHDGKTKTISRKEVYLMKCFRSKFCSRPRFCRKSESCGIFILFEFYILVWGRLKVK